MWVKTEELKRSVGKTCLSKVSAKNCGIPFLHPHTLRKLFLKKPNKTSSKVHQKKTERIFKFRPAQFCGDFGRRILSKPKRNSVSLIHFGLYVQSLLTEKWKQKFTRAYRHTGAHNWMVPYWKSGIFIVFYLRNIRRNMYLETEMKKRKVRLTAKLWKLYGWGKQFSKSG